MTEQQDEPKIIVDSDWKQEAAEEKARIEKETADVGTRPPLPEPSFVELVNMIVMQAAIALGGYKSATGELLPPDLPTAQHFIDLLEVLKNKTQGNLTDEESKAVDGVLYEMRMRYVEAVKAPPGAPSPPKSDG